MREILFKAKDSKSNEWVFGGYHFDSFINKHIIVEGGVGGDIEYVINPETLCQYTGEKDIEGNKIFEGDFAEIKIFTEFPKETKEEKS